MPNYGKNDINPNSWGYDFDKIAHMLAKCVEKHSKKKKVTIIMHDWGCRYGALLMNSRPDLVKRIVSLDIGGYEGYKVFGFWIFICQKTYTFFLAKCFLLGDPIGTYALRLLFFLIIDHRPNEEFRAQ